MLILAARDFARRRAFVRHSAVARGTITGLAKNRDTVAVRYRSDQPDVAKIDSFMSLWGLPVLLGGLGAVFLFVGLGILCGLLPV